MTHYFTLLFGLLLWGQAAAQMSLPLSPYRPTDEYELPSAGPYFLSADTLVYLDAGRVYLIGVNPGALPTAVAGRSAAPARAITQDDRGRVYVFRAGPGCDGGQPVASVDAIDRVAGGTWNSVATHSLPGVDFGAEGRYDIASTADGGFWLVSPAGVFTVAADGAVQKAEVPLSPFTADIRDIVATDLSRAYVADARYHAVARVGGAIYRVLDSTVVVDYDDGRDSEPQRLPTDGAISTAITSDGIALIRDRGDSLLLYDLTTGRYRRRAFYPDFPNWTIGGAAYGPNGGLATISHSAVLFCCTLEEIRQTSHSFLQYVPAGAELSQVGPAIDFSPELLSTTTLGGELAVALEATIVNESAVEIDSARIYVTTTNEICGDGPYSALVEGLRVGQTAVAANSAPYYAVGEGLEAGDAVGGRFYVAHVNRRPVPNGHRTPIIFVTSVGNTTMGADMRISPSLTSHMLRVEWTDARSQLTVVNALGQVAFRQNLSPVATSLMLDVSVLPQGAYYLALTGAEGTAVRQFQVVE